MQWRFLSVYLMLHSDIKNHAPHLQRLYIRGYCRDSLSTILKNHAPKYYFKGFRVKMVEISGILKIFKYAKCQQEHDSCRDYTKMSKKCSKTGPLFDHFDHFGYFGPKSGSIFEQNVQKDELLCKCRWHTLYLAEICDLSSENTDHIFSVF